MTKFYFHLRARDELTLDDEGAEFPSYSAALQEAALAARELLAEAIRNGKQYVADSFVIADAWGGGTGPLAPRDASSKTIRKWIKRFSVVSTASRYDVPVTHR